MNSVQTASNPVSRWCSKITAYFRFLNSRRRDQRFNVFPNPPALAGFAIVFLLLVLCLIGFADPLYIQHPLSPDFKKPYLWSIITQIGASDWLLIATGLILFALSFATADRFKGAKKVVWHRVFLNCWYMFSTVAFSGLLVLLLKQVFARARPLGAQLNDVWVTGHFQDAYLFGSFPSGHSTTAGAMAIGFSLLFPKFRYLFLLLGLLVGISRPALGVHFPSDVFAGLLLGGAFSYFWARSFAQKRLLFKFNNQGKLKLRGERRA